MYSLNGVALDANTDFDWNLTSDTKPLADLVRNSQSLPVPGMDGVASLASSTGAPVLPFVVNMPVASVEIMYALLEQPTLFLSLTASSTRRVEVEFLSASLSYPGLFDRADMTIMLRINDVYWRAASEVTSAAVALATASVDVSVFAGISAPISDALVRVKGAVGGLRVTDSAGSWFSYADAIPAGSYLIFDCATGFATVVTSDTWAGGSDVTGKVDYSGGPTGLRITPHFTTDPSIRSGLLTVTTTSRSSATVEVRGRNAYVVV